MKLKWNSNFVINTTVICCLIFMAVIYVLDGSSRIILNDETITAFDSSIGIDGPVADSIPFRQHQKMTDSIKRMRNLKNGEIMTAGGVMFGNIIGVDGAIDCDTCSLDWYQKHIGGDGLATQYYITLNGWQIKDNYFDNNYTQIYVKNGRSYLWINHINIPVKFRYDHRAHHLLIPVSKSIYTTTNILIIIFECIFVPFIFYLAACFINFLVDLSKGLPFTDGNLRRLLTIALSLLVMPLLSFLANLFIKFIFRSYFVPDVVMSREVWADSWKVIMPGMTFLLLYRAFRQGKLLKDEQDLTV